MNHLIHIFILSTTVFLTNCTKKETDSTQFICDNFTNKSYETEDKCTPKIMAYPFGLESQNPEQQVNTLYNLGMDGMILEIDIKKLPLLIEYYSAERVLNNQFQIYDIFTYIDIDDPNQINLIDNLYSIIKCTGTRLQIIFKASKKQNLTGTITKIANIAKTYNKILIIYPHHDTAIETAEEAFNYINNIAMDNIFLSVHLCHELAAGNGNRMNQVIKNVSPYIRSVSISGANLREKEDTSLPEWYWGIKPLSMGNYDYSDFINSLYLNDYKYPIAIHTWGIFENFNSKPNDYLPESKNIILKLSKSICK